MAAVVVIRLVQQKYYNQWFIVVEPACGVLDVVATMDDWCMCVRACVRQNFLVGAITLTSMEGF